MKKLIMVVVTLLLIGGVARADNKLSWTSGTKAAAGDNTLISAPAAGSCITVYFVQLQNESATTTVVKLTAGAGGSQFYRGSLSEASGVVLDVPNFSTPLRLPPATALVLNLSGANSHNYSVWYTIDRIR